MNHWTPSDAANEASDYFNSLPIEERRKLAPLLENYRQLGLAEARDAMLGVSRRLAEHIDRIQGRA